MIDNLQPTIAFSKIRDSIAIILQDEIRAYGSSNSNDFFIDLANRVFVERYIAIDYTEVPYVNVRYIQSVGEGNFNSFYNRFISSYEISIVTNGVTDSNPIDYNAAISNNIGVGLIHSILMNSVYVNLNLPTNEVEIFSRYVNGIEVNEIIGDVDDVNKNYRSRVSFDVTHNETFSGKEGSLISETHTTFALNDMAGGYQLIQNTI